MRRVGVADLDVDFGAGREDLLVGVEERTGTEGLLVGVEERAGTEGLAVGVEERARDLVGVDDLTAGVAVLVEGNVAREVGVDGLEGLVVAGRVARPVGVAGLLADFNPQEDEGLLVPLLEEFRPDGKVECLGAILPLETSSSWKFASCNPGQRQ